MVARKTFISPGSGLAVQFVKYAICGGLATAVNIAIFFLLGWLLLPCLKPDEFLVRVLHLRVQAIDNALRWQHAVVANTIAFLISNFAAYILNIRFVFQPGRHHWLLELGLFYAVSGVSFLIGTALMGCLIAQFGTTTALAFVSNMVVALLINFAMRKFVIFNG